MDAVTRPGLPPEAPPDAPGSIGSIRRAVLDAIDRFERNLGFTAPELWGMRVDQLRAQIEAAFDDPNPDEKDH